MNDRFYSSAKALVATIRAGSMTAAARELKTTKSGISQKISGLESDLGLKLLDRTGRSVTVTTAGQRIFETCSPMVDAALEAEALLGEGTGEQLSGRVAVSGPNSFMTRVIMPIVSEFTSNHPKVRMELKASDWNVDFAAADIDLGFRIGSVPEGRFIKNRISATRRLLCASPDCLAPWADLMHPSDLADIPCILRHQEAHTWQLFGPEGRLETVEPTDAIIVDTMEMAQSAASEGIGVALIPSLAAHSDIKVGELAPVLPQWRSDTLDVTLLCRPSSLPKPQVAALRRFLIDRCTDQVM